MAAGQCLTATGQEPSDHDVRGVREVGGSEPANVAPATEAGDPTPASDEGAEGKGCVLIGGEACCRAPPMCQIGDVGRDRPATGAGRST